MKLSLFGRLTMALFASLTLGLGMTACGGGTIGYMWVLGQQYNQISGFKIDDYTGNLTGIVGSPFSTNGAVPVSIVVKPGGRYVYVINQGTGGGLQNGKLVQGTGQGIALFSVGGDGTLTFQQTYATTGANSMWAQFDSSGSYLYVLDKYGPNYQPDPTKANYDPNGAITAFSVDGGTGRLTLLTNSQTQIGGLNTAAFEVGQSPLMMKSTGGCLYTVNSADQTVSPFTFSTGGQLAFTTTKTIVTQASKISSINSGGNYIYLTDTGANQVLQYTSAGNCGLTVTTGNRTPNFTGATNPNYIFVDSTGNYVYALNGSTTSTSVTTPFSSISYWHVNSTSGQLEPLSTTTYKVGSGPVCMVEDPSNQYMYISNHNDGTVSGALFDPTHGYLSDLKRGSTFTASGLSSCLASYGANN